MRRTTQTQKREWLRRWLRVAGYRRGPLGRERYRLMIDQARATLFSPKTSRVDVEVSMSKFLDRGLR